MSTITVKKSVRAPLGLVFRTISDIRNFSKAVPDIVNVEFLTDQKYGSGTKFRETRTMNGKQVSTELEVRELVEDEYIRIVSDAGGTIWDSVFSVSEQDGMTELQLVMHAKPYKLTARFINLFIKGMMVKALEKDIQSVKDYCERVS